LKTLKIIATFIFLSLLSVSFAQKEEQPTTRILFILDASKSMSGSWQGEEKFKLASRILSQVLDSLEGRPKLELALRVYGHQRNYPPQNCNDSRLEVAFAPNNGERIKFRLKQIRPRGTSPIAISLERAATDFGNCDNCRNIIILITDGIEECGGDLCAVSAELQKKGIAIKPFVIGIGNDTRADFECAGTYFNAPNTERFSKALNIIITRIMSKTSLQVNLLDKNGEPKETNVNMAFTDLASGRVKYNFVHTLNHKGLPDTLVVDPLLKYSIQLATIPPVTITDFSITEGKHNIVYANCTRGWLKVNLKDRNPADFKPSVLVYDKNDKLINVQALGENIKYLEGDYRLKILTLPLTDIDSIVIAADETTRVLIDNPGILSVQKNIRGYGTIYKLLPNGQQEMVIKLNEQLSSSESIYLQPGLYRLIFRPLRSSESVFTISNDFEIVSGMTTRIRP